MRQRRARRLAGRMRTTSPRWRLVLALVAAAWCGSPVAAEDAPPDPKAQADDLSRLLRRAQDERRAHRVRTGSRGVWAVRRDGGLVAAGTPEGKIEVWLPTVASPLEVLEGHPDLIDGLAFEPSTFLHSVGWEGTLRTWNIATEKLVATLDPKAHLAAGADDAGARHSLRVTAVRVSPDGRFLAALGPTLMVRDQHSGKFLEEFDSQPRPRDALFLGDSRHLVLVGATGLEVYDLLAPVAADGGKAARRKPVWVTWERGWREPDAVTVLADVDASGVIVTLTQRLDADDVVRGWDRRTGTLLWKREYPWMTSTAMDAPSSKLVPILRGRFLEMLSPKDGSVVRSVDLGSGPLPHALAPDASVGFTAGRDGKLVRIPLAEPSAPK